MRLNIQIDEAQLRDIEVKLGTLQRKTPQVISRALNRSLTTMQTKLKSEVRKEYHIKAGDINLTLSNKKATASNLNVNLTSKGSPIPLDKYKVSPKTVNPKRKNSLKVAVKKSSARVLPEAFMADINGAKLFKRSGKQRLPIERLFGPSVPQMAGKEATVDEIQKFGIETYDKRVEHEISRILGRNQ